MRKVGQAGMLAAILFAPGCGEEPEASSSDPMEPLRRATFRTLAARDFLSSCPGGPSRAESLAQFRRHEELKQLALAKRASQAIWLGENDWAGVARYSQREGCEAGEEPYREALVGFASALDALAGRIAAYRE
jgi:hypothetical protein